MLAFDEMHGNYNMSSQLQLHSNKRPTDFTFCDIPKTKSNQLEDENEDNIDFSPPLWSKNVHSNHKGPSSSKTTMVEGREELMEMIEDLPESCYDLSLSYMVAKDTKPKLKEEKKGAKKGPVSRSVSLDTGVFLLRMFVPSSFGLKKHTVSRSTSMDCLKKHHVDVKRWKTWLFAHDKDSVSSRSSYDNKWYRTTTKNRYAEETLKPGCWFKSTSQKGCIFF